MRRALELGIPLFAGLASAACSLGGASDSSCDRATDEISVVAVVLDIGAQIRAEIDFEAGDRASVGSELRLCEQDVLTIEGEDPSETEHPDRVVYSSTFAAAPADRIIDFELEREAAERITIAVELPPAFDIVAPIADQQVPRSADFLLQWAPPVDGAQIRIGLAEEIGYGICLRTENTEHDYKDADGVWVADDGDWLVPADVILGDEAVACEATYELSRVRAADYPDALGSGGFAEGRVVRSVAFVSVP